MVLRIKYDGVHPIVTAIVLICVFPGLIAEPSRPVLLVI